MVGSVTGGLGAAGHAVASKADLAAHDIAGIPGGLEQAVATTYNQTASRITGNSATQAKADAQSAALARGTVKGVVTSVQHPLRDPFQTALNLAAVISAGAGAAARVGAAADAAQAASEAGIAGRVADVGKALVSKPPVRLRVLNVPKLVAPEGEGPAALTHEAAPLQASTNPAVRAAQAIHDAVVQKSLNANVSTAQPSRIAQYGMSRVAKSADETTRIAQRVRVVPTQMLERAGTSKFGVASPFDSGVSQPAGQLALFLRSANVTGKEAADYWAAQAARGVNPKATGALSKLAQQVHDQELVHLDETGNVSVNAPKYPKLAAANDLLAENQATRANVIAEHGLMTPEGMQNRLDLVAQRMAGGQYVKPTPAKLGTSAALIRAVSARDRLAALHGKALDQEAEWLRQSRSRDLGPLSEQDAQTRLAELDAIHQGLLERIVPETSQYGPDVAKAEQLRRNFENSRVGKGNRIGAKPIRNLKSEELANADAALRDTIARNPDSEAAQHMAQLLNERDALRAALNDRAESAFAGEQPAPLPNAPASTHASVPAAANPHATRVSQLGNALELAQERADRMAEAASRREGPTGMVGGEGARPGQGYVPLRTSVKGAPRSPIAAARTPIIGKVRGFVTGKPATGEGVAKGLVPDNTTAGVARATREALRHLGTVEHRGLIAKYGSDVRRTGEDVLVADPRAAALGKIPTNIDELLGKSKSTLGTISEQEHEGIAAAMRAHLEDAIPGLRDNFAENRSAELGTRAPQGYKWVHEKLLGQLVQETTPRGPIEKFADNANSLVTGMTVYFKLSHIPQRFFTDATTNALQGSLTPRGIRAAIQMRKALTEREYNEAAAATGAHGYQALPQEGTSKVAQITRRGAAFYAKNVDAPFRFVSLVHEADRMGFGTPEKFRALIAYAKDPRADVAQAGEMRFVLARANRASMMYDGLGPYEKRILARGLWFYPWTKAAVRFGFHTASEHPFKAALGGAAGVTGREEQQRLLGDVPSYEYGLIPFGGGANPETSDLSMLTPFGTAANVVEAAARPAQIAGFANPVYGSTLTAVTGLNQYGGKTKSPLSTGLAELFAPTPEFQALSAYLHPPRPTQIFRKTPGSALARALGGAAVPRKVNRAALNSSAAREKAGR